MWSHDEKAYVSSVFSGKTGKLPPQSAPRSITLTITDGLGLAGARLPLIDSSTKPSITPVAGDESPSGTYRRDPQSSAISQPEGSTDVAKLFARREIVDRPQPKTPLRNHSYHRLELPVVDGQDPTFKHGATSARPPFLLIWS